MYEHHGAEEVAHEAHRDRCDAHRKQCGSVEPGAGGCGALASAVGPEGSGRGRESDRRASGPCRTVACAGASGCDRRRLRIVRGIAPVLRRTWPGGDVPPWRVAARGDQSARDHRNLYAVDTEVGEHVVVEPRELRYRPPLPDRTGDPAVRIGPDPGQGTRGGSESPADRFGLKLPGSGGVSQVYLRIEGKRRLAFMAGGVVHGLCPGLAVRYRDIWGWAAFGTTGNFFALSMEKPVRRQ